MKKAKDDAEAIMKEGVAQTLELAKENGVTLDFSDKSIDAVEKLLGECHREFKKSKDEEGFHGLAIMFAAYIGEVIRKKGLGGTWSRNHADFGEDSFPFHWQDHDLFLYGWCAKRIFDGPGDNVAFKYKVMVLDNLKGKKGKK